MGNSLRGGVGDSDREREGAAGATQNKEKNKTCVHRDDGERGGRASENKV